MELFHIAIFLTCVVNLVLVSGQTHICEKSQGDLNCPSGQVINVTSASYGRENTTICPTNATTTNTTNCPSINVTEIVRDICNGAQDCTIQFSDVNPDDPCLNVTKYLTVNYKCNNISKITCGRHEHYSLVVCDTINQCQTPDYPMNPLCNTNGGCACNFDYLKDPITGKCVGQDFCAQGKLTETHEEFTECANHQRTCNGQYRWPRFRCVPGYGCAPGYLRDVMTSLCVRPDECPRPFPRG